MHDAVMMKADIWICAASVLYTCALCASPPSVINDSGSAIIVPENTPVGTVLRALDTEDADGDYITVRYPDYETESRSLVLIKLVTTGPSHGRANLILNATLDRDFNAGVRSLQFVLDDGTLQLTVQIELIITDVNDEAPSFENVPYRLDLREDQQLSSSIYDSIHASDPDTGRGGQVAYNIEPVTQSTADAEVFGATFSIQPATGVLALTRSLNFEEIQFFHFAVTAADGLGLNSTVELIIRILDVQDTAPQFLGLPYVIVLTENAPLNEHVFTIRALDGDRGVPNELTFSFTGAGSCAYAFAIDDNTGEITVAANIDRDNGTVYDHDGVCDVIAVVSEVETNVPQLGATSATTTVTVFVGDENDNAPVFSRPRYSARIEDTAQLNYPLKLDNDGAITVQDRDQGNNGVMEIMLRDEAGVLTFDFEPIPNIVATNSDIIITLKSPHILWSRDTVTLTIIAVERDTVERLSSTASIDINIVNVATTAVWTTTTPITTTPRYKDTFVPSILAVVFAAILLVWAGVVTCWYCITRQGHNNNQVGHRDFPVPPTAYDSHKNFLTNGNRMSPAHIPPVAASNA